MGLLNKAIEMASDISLW